MIKNIYYKSVQIQKAFFNGNPIIISSDPDAEIKALFSGGKQGVFYKVSPENLWQDAARTVPVINSGDPVRVIDDLSGNGNHAIAPSSSARPVYRTDGILHWLEPDGIDDRMITNNFGMNQPLSIFISSRADKADNVLMDGLFINTARLRVHSVIGYQLYAGLSITDVNNYTGQTKIYNAVINGVNSIISLSGTSAVAGNAGNSVGGGLTLFATAGNTINMQGKFYGVLAINNLLSSTEKNNVNAYLAKKSGVIL